MSWSATYSTGTISIANGATEVVGTGTLWEPLADQANLLFVGGLVALVTAVPDDTHLAIPEWTGDAVVDADYVLVQFPLASLLAARQLRDILAKLAEQGVIYHVTGTEPDDEFGNDGDFALKVNAQPWTMWVKVAGEWEVQGYTFDPVYLQTHGADIAAAATINLEGATGAVVNVTGNTTISTVTLNDGQQRWVHFTGAPLLDVGANLIGNGGGADIQVAAGDVAVFRGFPSSVVRFTLFRASGKPVVAMTAADVSDASADGRSLITAADYAAMKALLAVTAADITDASALGRSNLKFTRTPHGDSNYTILATDRIVATNAAFTAPRTFTLPAASTVAAGAILFVVDAAGGITSTNTLTVARAGSDTINGGSASLVINMARGWVVLECDGASAWTIIGFKRARKITRYTSGSGNHTWEPGCRSAWVRGKGGGGGGSHCGGTSVSPTAGGNTTFGSLTANGGGAGTLGATGGAGGAASGADVNRTGQAGFGVNNGSADNPGGAGGGRFGAPGMWSGNGLVAPANSGCGGGSTSNGTAPAGAGGGEGGEFEHTFNAPTGTAAYAVGAAGVGGTSSSGFHGGAGAAGDILVIEDF